jgi:hypothetical protein
MFTSLTFPQALNNHTLAQHAIAALSHTIASLQAMATAQRSVIYVAQLRVLAKIAGVLVAGPLLQQHKRLLPEAIVEGWRGRYLFNLSQCVFY